MHAIVPSAATWNIAATIAAMPQMPTSQRLPVIADIRTADKRLSANSQKCFSKKLANTFKVFVSFFVYF